MPYKRKCLLFLLILLFNILIVPVFSAKANLELYFVFKDDWIPGNAFGHPGFVALGNFSGKGDNEILIISSIPDRGDVMTLTTFNSNNLSVSGSTDRDFSSVYQQLTDDFDGDGDIELFFSEEWTNDMGIHQGSHHLIYDFKGHTFTRNESYYFNNPDVFLNIATTYDVNQDNDAELFLVAWDEFLNAEIIQLLDYSNNDLNLLANVSIFNTNDFYYRTVLFVGVGQFLTDYTIDLITISRWSIESDPTNFIVTCEVFQYKPNSNSLEHILSDSLDIKSSSVFFDIYDIDSDEQDELIIYYDNIYSPTLSIYEINELGATVEYFINRMHSSYPSSNWHCTDIKALDLDDDDSQEILISEAKLDFSINFLGRYEIYEIEGTSLESELLQEINMPPTRTTIGDIDQFDDIEIVSVFNDYSLENYTTTGGIEIWSTGKKKTKLLSIFDSPINAFIQLITATIILLSIKRKKHLSYRNKSNNPSL